MSHGARGEEKAAEASRAKKIRAPALERVEVFTLYELAARLLPLRNPSGGNPWGETQNALLLKLEQAAASQRLRVRHPATLLSEDFSEWAQPSRSCLVTTIADVNEWFASEGVPYSVASTRDSEPISDGSSPAPHDPSPLLVAVTGKATGEAALIAATWPAPAWARWLEVDSLTLEQAAALSIDKEPGQQRAHAEAGTSRATHWVIAELTFPEARRRLLILRDSFPTNRITLTELAAFVARQPTAQRWTVPDQISRVLPQPGALGIMKKSALVAAFKHEWPTIAKDIQDGSRNGLTDAAHTRTHGFWDGDSARQWAVSRGRIQQDAAGPALATAWYRSMRHDKLKG